MKRKKRNRERALHKPVRVFTSCSAGRRGAAIVIDAIDLVASSTASPSAVDSLIGSIEDGNELCVCLSAFLLSFAADHLTPTGASSRVAAGSGAAAVFSPRFYQRRVTESMGGGTEESKHIMSTQEARDKHRSSRIFFCARFARPLRHLRRLLHTHTPHKAHVLLSLFPTKVR